MYNNLTERLALIESDCDECKGMRNNCDLKSEKDIIQKHLEREDVRGSNMSALSRYLEEQLKKHDIYPDDCKWDYTIPCLPDEKNQLCQLCKADEEKSAKEDETHIYES